MNDDVKLRLIGVLDAIRSIFMGADPHTLLPIGAIRTTRTDPSPHPLPFVPVPIEKLASMLPEVLAVMKDEVQLMILHPFVPAASKTTPRKFRGHAIPYWKNKVHVDAFCCLAIPVRVMGEDAADSLLQLCAIRSVPEPSLLLTSGWNITALWLLSTETTGDRRPPRNLTNERNARLLLTDEIAKRLTELSPNAKDAKDVVSWHVMPGSVDPESGEIVQAVQVGNAMRYFTLTEIHDELLLTADDTSNLHRDANVVYGDLKTKWAAKGSSGKSGKKSTGKQAGPKSDERRVREMRQLVEYRSGNLTKEEQYAAIYYFAAAAYRDTWIKSAGAASNKDRHAVSYEGMQKAVNDLVERFHDPIAANEIKKACRSGYWNTASNHTVASKLHVSDEEAEAIGLKSLASEVVKKKRAWRAQLKTMPGEAAKHEIEQWAVRLLGRGYSYGVVEKATGIPKSSVRNIRKRVYGERYIKPLPLRPKHYWTRVIEEKVNGKKLLRVESSDALMGDEEVTDESFSDDDSLS